MAVSSRERDGIAAVVRPRRRDPSMGGTEGSCDKGGRCRVLVENRRSMSHDKACAKDKGCKICDSTGEGGAFGVDRI